MAGNRYSEHCRRLISTWFATHFTKMTRRNRSQVNDLLKRLDVLEKVGHQGLRCRWGKGLLLNGSLDGVNAGSNAS